MHLIRENGFLSWPTPRVVNTEGGTAKNVELKDGSFSRVNTDCVKFGVKLKDAVDQQKKYPTPNVSDSKGANMAPESDGVPHDIKKRYLRGMVFDNKKQRPTVRVSSANGSSEKEIAEGNPKYRLETTVDIIERNLYPTPSARDYKGGSGTIVEKDGKFHRVSNTTSTKFGARLDAVVDVLEKKKYTTPATDSATNRKDKKGYALSPEWVEKMMGVPQGWTALDGTSNEWNGIESWADGSWDSGPRVVQHCEDRIDRIRLLGNGVVPATAAKAWIILEQQLDEDSN